MGLVVFAIINVVIIIQNIQQSQINEAAIQESLQSMNISMLQVIESCATPKEIPADDVLCISYMNYIKESCKDSKFHVPACDDARIEQIISSRSKNLVTGVGTAIVTPIDDRVDVKTSYAVTFTVVTSDQDVKSEEITFPDGFDVSNAKITYVAASESKVAIGTLTVQGQTLIWNHHIAKHYCCLFIAMTITDIVNGNTLSNQVSIVTKDPNGIVIEGPTIATFQLVN